MISLNFLQSEPSGTFYSWRATSLEDEMDLKYFGGYLTSGALLLFAFHLPFWGWYTLFIKLTVSLLPLLLSVTYDLAISLCVFLSSQHVSMELDLMSWIRALFLSFFLFFPKFPSIFVTQVWKPKWLHQLNIVRFYSVTKVRMLACCIPLCMNWGLGISKQVHKGVPRDAISQA